MNFIFGPESQNKQKISNTAFFEENLGKKFNFFTKKEVFFWNFWNIDLKTKKWKIEF